MKLYVTRHGETNYNVQKLCNADPAVDVHLTDKGRQQAASLHEQLLSIPFDAAYISELPRTRQTAGIILGNRTVPLLTDNRLNDNRTGFEGLSVDDWLDALSVAADKWAASFNGGESLDDVFLRVEDFLHDLRSKPYEAVLIVTHGTVTQCIAAIAQGKTLPEVFAIGSPQGTYQTFEV